MTLDLPAEVAGFLAQHISTVHDLEVLILLRSERRPWRSSEIAAALASSEEAAGVTLASFRDKGLVAAAGDGFAYTPSGRMDQLVVLTIDTYETMRVRVITAIYRNPARSPLHAFAEAFRLERDS